MLFLLAPSHSHLFHWVGFIWLSLGRDKAKLVERGAGAGRHVGEAANTCWWLTLNRPATGLRPAAVGRLRGLFCHLGPKSWGRLLAALSLRQGFCRRSWRRRYLAYACRCTAFVRGTAGGASPDFGAAEAVLVLVLAHVPGQVAVARRVEGPERDGESPLGTLSSRLSLRPGSGPASP